MPMHKVTFTIRPRFGFNLYGMTTVFGTDPTKAAERIAETFSKVIGVRYTVTQVDSYPDDPKVFQATLESGLDNNSGLTLLFEFA